MASQRQLNVLRQGFAEHGRAWLREELASHQVKELHGVAAAAGGPRHVHGRRLSREELLDALLRCIAQKEASWGDRCLRLCFVPRLEVVLSCRVSVRTMRPRRPGNSSMSYDQWEEGEYTDQHIIEEHGAAIWYKFLWKRHHRREAQRRQACEHEEWLSRDFSSDTD